MLGSHTMTRTTFHLLTVTMVTRSLSSEITELCPYNKLCSGSPLPSTTARPWRSCCMPCSCEPRCEIVGTCCPDYHGDASVPTVPCRKQAKIYEKYLRIQILFPLGEQGYRVVDICRDTEPENNTDTDSERFIHVLHCSKAHDIHDLIFVTSTTTGITYLNKHCAMCNGEYAYEEWELHLVAVNNLFISIAERDEYALSTGNVRSVTTSESILRTSRCDLLVIDKCNLTNKWDVYDRALEEKCATYGMVYYSLDARKVSFGKVVFKNPYCFLCNKPAGYNVRHDCDNLTQVLYEGSRKVRVPFSALLRVYDDADSSSAADNVPKMPCNRDEIIDPFLNQCSRLLCPPGMTALQGRCEPILDHVHGYNLEISYKIHIAPSDIRDALNHTDIINDLTKFVLGKINNKTTNCAACTSTIHETVDDEFIIRIEFKSLKKCHYLHLLDKFSLTYNLSPMEVFIDYYPYHINISVKNDLNRFNLKTLAYYGYGNNCWSQLIYNQDIIHCPSIVFDVNVIADLLQCTSGGHALFEMMTEVGNGTARVCLEQYQNIISLALTSGKGKPSTREIFLSFMILRFLV